MIIGSELAVAAADSVLVVARLQCEEALRLGGGGHGGSARHTICVAMAPFTVIVKGRRH
jgi:hypothetical protein